jgi:hypothetical protein
MKLDLNINIRDCQEGERKSSNTCPPYQQGTYNLNLGDICKDCIKNSVSFGRSLIVLRQGISDRTVKCLFRMLAWEQLKFKSFRTLRSRL